MNKPIGGEIELRSRITTSATWLPILNSKHTKHSLTTVISKHHRTLDRIQQPTDAQHQTHLISYHNRFVLTKLMSASPD